MCQVFMPLINILTERDKNRSAFCLFFYFHHRILKRVEPKRVRFFISLINILRKSNENGSEDLFP